MVELEYFLHGKMSSLGARTYKQYLCNEVIYHWRELVDATIADKVKPVKIEHGTLFVDVKSSAFKDQLKFLSAEIIDTINEKFGEGEPLVKEIRVAQGFQIADMPPDKISTSAQIEKPKLTPEDMTLTDAEIQRCEEQSQKISDASLRQTIFETFVNHLKSQKFRLATGWHKCLRCESLCEPEEFFCEVCKVKEREAMVNALFDIFYNAPQTKTHEAQKILSDKFPQMKNECRPEIIESARTSLIQKLASKVRFGDEKSPDVLKLVALEKRLPMDKLTPSIIQRTLIDLQFNLSEQPRYNALKSRK